MKKIIVIGTGIGGLSAAALLAAAGHRVTVIEKNSVPGGKLGQIRMGGFRFDTGPSLLTMPFVLENLFRMCGKDLHDYIRLQQLDEICRYHYSDGTVFKTYSDPEKTLSEIRRIAPEDCDAYLKFMRYSRELYNRTAGSFLNNPLYSLADFKNLQFLDIFRIDALKTVSDRVDKSFRSDYLRLFFKRFTTYNGSSPYQAPATLNVIPHVELTMGASYIKGGLYSLSDALMKLGAGFGAEYIFNEKSSASLAVIIRYGKSLQSLVKVLSATLFSRTVMQPKPISDCYRMIFLMWQ
jgi:phytoene desaturase